jgi:hypothetical protein
MISFAMQIISRLQYIRSFPQTSMYHTFSRARNDDLLHILSVGRMIGCKIDDDFYSLTSSSPYGWTWRF